MIWTLKFSKPTKFHQSKKSSIKFTTSFIRGQKFSPNWFLYTYTKINLVKSTVKVHLMIISIKIMRQFVTSFSDFWVIHINAKKLNEVANTYLNIKYINKKHLNWNYMSYNQNEKIYLRDVQGQSLGQSQAETGSLQSW